MPRSPSFKWVRSDSLPVQRRHDSTVHFPTGYVPHVVSAYNLKWSKLREWLLEKRFRGVPELAEYLAKTLGYEEDTYCFHLPKALNDSDYKDIERLRDIKRTITNTKQDPPDPNPEDDDSD
ncbi:hypothetical protein PG987_006817 [Apiospora arundinis]